MRTLAPLLTAALLLIASGNAWAIYQCRDASGTVVFQDHPCAASQKTEREIDAPAGAPKGESTSIRVAVPPIGDAVIRVPAGWVPQVQSGNSALAPVVMLRTHGEGGRAELMVTLSPDDTGVLASDPVIDEEISRSGLPFVAGSVQGKTAPTRLSTANGTGAYASYTARERKPIPAFASRTVGAFSTKGIYCTFILSVDDLASDSQKAGLGIVSRGIALAPKK